MQKMKCRLAQIICIVNIVVLMLGIPECTIAEQVETKPKIESPWSIVDYVCISSVIYFINNSGKVYSWDGSADNAPQYIAECSYTTHLLSDNESLLIFDEATMLLQRYNGKTFVPLGNIALLPKNSVSDEYSSKPRRYKTVLLINNKIMVFCEEESDSNPFCVISGYDIETKSEIRFEISKIKDVFMYKQDEVIVLQQDEDLSHADQSQLLILNVRTRSTRKLLSAPSNDLGGVVFSDLGSRFYWMVDGQVYCLDEGETRPEIVAYLNMRPGSYEKFGYKAMLIADKRYALFLPNGSLLSSRTDQDSIAKCTLRIAGGELDDAYYEFCKNNPNVSVIMNMSDEITGNRIQQLIASGDNSTDLFVLWLDQGFSELKNAGYCADLSGSTLIRETIQSYYEPIRSALSLDDKPYAIPMYFYLSNWTFNESLWKALFDTRKPPATFSELLDFMQEWNDDYSDKYPDVIPLEYSGSKQEFLVKATEQYILQNYINNTTLHFNTLEYRAMLESILLLPIQESTTFEEEAEFLSSKKLFTMLPLKQLGVMEEDGERLIPISPPMFSPEQTPAIPIGMLVYILNPLCENKDIALNYLETALQSLDPITKASLGKEWNQPILSASNQAKLNELVLQQADLIKRSENASSDTKKDIDDQLSRIDLEMQYLNKHLYLASEEDISYYHQLAPYMVVPVNSPFFTRNSKEMTTITVILERLIEGQINIDQCLTELDRKASMILAEDMIR